MCNITKKPCRARLSNNVVHSLFFIFLLMAFTHNRPFSHDHTAQQQQKNTSWKWRAKIKKRMRQSTTANQSKIKISEACIVPMLPLRSPYNCIICISMCRNPWMLTGERSGTPTRHTVACILYLDLEKLRHTRTFTLIFEKARGKKIKKRSTNDERLHHKLHTHKNCVRRRGEGKHERERIKTI